MSQEKTQEHNRLKQLIAVLKKKYEHTLSTLYEMERRKSGIDAATIVRYQETQKNLEKQLIQAHIAIAQTQYFREESEEENEALRDQLVALKSLIVKTNENQSNRLETPDYSLQSEEVETYKLQAAAAKVKVREFQELFQLGKEQNRRQKERIEKFISALQEREKRIHTLQEYERGFKKVNEQKQLFEKETQNQKLHLKKLQEQYDNAAHELKEVTHRAKTQDRVVRFLRERSEESHLEVTELQNQLQASRTAIADCTQQLEKSFLELQEFKALAQREEQEKNAALDEFDAIQHQFKAIKQQLHSTKIDLEQRDHLIAELKQEMELVKHEKQKFEEQCLRKQEELKAANLNLESTQQKLVSSLDELNLLKEQHTELLRQKEELKRHLHEVQASFHEAQDEVTLLQDQLINASQEVKKSHTSFHEQKEQFIQEYSEKEALLQAQISRAHKEKELVSQAIKARFEEVRRSLVLKYQEEMEQWKKKCDRQSIEREEQEQKIEASFCDQILALEGQIAHLENEIMLSKRALEEQFQKERQVFQAENENLTILHTKEKEELQLAYQNALQQHQEQHNLDVEAQKKLSEEELKLLEDQVNQLRTALHQLNLEKENALDLQKIEMDERLRLVLDESKEKECAYETKMEELKHSLNQVHQGETQHLLERIAGLEKENQENLERQKTTFDEEIKRIEAELLSSKEQNQQKQELNGELGQIKKELEEKLRETVRRLEQSQDSVRAKEHDVQKCKDLLHQKERAIDETKSQLNALSHEKQKLHEQLNHSQIVGDEAEVRVKTAQQHLAKKVKETSELTEQNEAFRLECLENKKSIESYKNKIDDLQNSLNLQHQLEKRLQDELQEIKSTSEKKVNRWRDDYARMKEKWEQADTQVREFKRLEDRHNQLQHLLQDLGGIMKTPSKEAVNPTTPVEEAKIYTATPAASLEEEEVHSEVPPLNDEIKEDTPDLFQPGKAASYYKQNLFE